MQINKFRPQFEIKPKKNYAFFGMRGSGKTMVMRDVGYFIRNIGEALVFSATEDGNHTWGTHVPTTFIHTEFKPAVLARALERQKARFAAHEADPENVPYPHLLIVFEDMMAENKSFMKDKSVRWIFMNGRHAGITMMMTVQYLMDMERSLRGNIDYVFCMIDDSVGNAERIWSQWCGMACPDKSKFYEIYNKVTEDFGCLVIRCGRNGLTQGPNLTRKLAWYRAVDRGNYKIGNRSFWAFHFRYGAGRTQAARLQEARPDARPTRPAARTPRPQRTAARPARRRPASRAPRRSLRGGRSARRGSLIRRR